MRSIALIACIAAAICHAQQARESLEKRADDDAKRIESLEKYGSRLEGAHIILYFPESLTRLEAEALIKRLDPAVGGLWRRVGVHDWQLVPKGKIKYYLGEDDFVAHANGRSAVFVPMARVKDGRAPFLHEATHELLASKHRPPGVLLGPGVVRWPLWLIEGMADYLARVVGHEFGIIEAGAWGTPTVDGVDAVCAERLRTPEGAKMMPFVGANAFPDVLITAERVKFAPAFYACSFSLTKRLAEHVGLDNLIGLFAVPPEESLRRLDKVAGRPLVQVVQEWRTRLGE